jgi:hypothetical protein
MNSTFNGTPLPNVPAYGNLIPDFQGGLVVIDTSSGSITKLDGITGQPYPPYTPTAAQGFDFAGIAVHTDGTIFAVQYNPGTEVNGVYGVGAQTSVVGINPITGGQIFTVPLEPQPVYAGGNFTGNCRTQLRDYFERANFSSPIVAGDGYAYLAYEYPEQLFGGCADETQSEVNHIMLLRVSSSGAYDQIEIVDVPGSLPGFSPPDGSVFQATLITNADTGVLVSWRIDWPTAEGNNPAPVSGMAVTNGTSVTLLNQPQLPLPASCLPFVTPVLKAQDGSFVGTAYTCSGPDLMVAFDAGGNTRWIVPNEQPQAETADGHTLGQSGILYDDTGSAVGQITPRTQSLSLNTYQDGPVQQVVLTPIDYLFGFAAVQAVPGTFFRPKTMPQDALIALANANLKATPQCDGILKALANINHVSEGSLILQLKTMANAARVSVFDGPRSSNVPLDPVKFPGAASPGVTTVSEWFAARSNEANFADGLSQSNGPAVFFRLNDWISWAVVWKSKFSLFSGNPNYYGMGTVMHEILHKQAVGGGFTHEKMDTAIEAVLGTLPTASYKNSDSLGLGLACFGNLR